jgi:predicted helicase
MEHPIQIIVGNPPYSVGQKSENDNNQNEDYPALDKSIKLTYVAKSNAKSKMHLYDSYVRAIRWASNRLQGCGIVAFITNGSFIDANSMDGLRKCLIEEFDHLYVFNLRGAIRGKSPELREKEGKNVFDIMTGVAISLMIRNGPKFIPLGKLHYYDIGDSLNREEKFAKINDLGSIACIPWEALIPNAAGDWIKQRGEIFGKFVPMENKIFNIYSCGILTSRDSWMYNSSRFQMEHNMQLTIATFNENSRKYIEQSKNMPKNCQPRIEDIININSKQINWSYKLKENLRNGMMYFSNAKAARLSMYRPFAKQWLYFDLPFIERSYKQSFLFPVPECENTVISCTNSAKKRGFSSFVASLIPDFQINHNSKCFPLYYYEKHNATKSRQGEMFSNGGEADEFDYVRREAITDWALDTFREHYGDSSISKEDIFWYIYEILHSPEYKTCFANWSSHKIRAGRSCLRYE